MLPRCIRRDVSSPRRGTGAETVIARTRLRHREDLLRAIAVGVAIVVTVACGTSRLESWGIFSALIAKGRTALQVSDRGYQNHGR